MNDVMVPKKGVTEENVEEILFRHVHHRNRYVLIHFRFICLKSKKNIIMIGYAAMNELWFLNMLCAFQLFNIFNSKIL